MCLPFHFLPGSQLWLTPGREDTHKEAVGRDDLVSSVSGETEC